MVVSEEAIICVQSNLPVSAVPPDPSFSSSQCAPLLLEPSFPSSFCCSIEASLAAQREHVLLLVTDSPSAAVAAAEGASRFELERRESADELEDAEGACTWSWLGPWDSFAGEVEWAKAPLWGSDARPVSR